MSKNAFLNTAESLEQYKIFVFFSSKTSSVYLFRAALYELIIVVLHKDVLCHLPSLWTRVIQNDKLVNDVVYYAKLQALACICKEKTTGKRQLKRLASLSCFVLLVLSVTASKILALKAGTSIDLASQPCRPACLDSTPALVEATSNVPVFFLCLGFFEN